MQLSIDGIRPSEARGSLLDNVVILLCFVQNIAAFGQICGLDVVKKTTKSYFESMNISPPSLPGALNLHQQLLKDEFVSYLTLCLYDL